MSLLPLKYFFYVFPFPTKHILYYLNYLYKKKLAEVIEIYLVVFIESEVREAESKEWSDGFGRQEEQGVPGEGRLTRQKEGGVYCR